jgi:hypothetical protein
VLFFQNLTACFSRSLKACLDLLSCCSEITNVALAIEQKLHNFCLSRTSETHKLIFAMMKVSKTIEEEQVSMNLHIPWQAIMVDVLMFWRNKGED